jgi:hypothetical protein
MGHLATEHNRKGIAEFGNEFWEIHVAIVNKYWENIDHYCDTLKIGERGLKLYQDGMMTDGELAMKIIADSVKMGSRNFEIISKLVSDGAEIVKTEDLDLVKKELELLNSIPSSNLFLLKALKIIILRWKRSHLLKKRDDFIASRIAVTLQQGETGLIFIGAYHNILRKLPKDIKIVEVKEISKVRKYQKLLPFYNRKKQRFKLLSRYLINPISDDLR